MIVAVSLPEWVIGVNDVPSGRIPWHHSEDLKRFKRLTINNTVVMGRRTYETIGRALPHRRNIVVSSTIDPTTLPDGVEVFTSLESALEACEGEVWLIGGAQIYAEGMKHAELIDVTLVPDRIDAMGAVIFPPIDPEVFSAGPDEPYEEAPELKRRIYRRIHRP